MEIKPAGEGQVAHLETGENIPPSVTSYVRATRDRAGCVCG